MENPFKHNQTVRHLLIMLLIRYEGKQHAQEYITGGRPGGNFEKESERKNLTDACLPCCLACDMINKNTSKFIQHSSLAII